MTMTCNQYLHLMSAIGTMYDFHPDFFDDITPEERLALSDVFLFDFDERYGSFDDFPQSVEKFFHETIEPNKELQEKALAAWAHIHELAHMGEFKIENVSDVHPREGVI